MLRSKWEHFFVIFMVMLFLTGLFLALYPYIQGAAVDRRMTLEAEAFLSRLSGDPDDGELDIIVFPTVPEAEEERKHQDLWDAMTAYNESIYAEGQAFNQTRAGVHADGLMKDEEIYTIFDTRKILNKPATVQISKTSGLAGIAYWINQTYRLEGDEKLDKRSELVTAMKEWVDLQYEEGRQTAMTDRELEEKIEELAPGRYTRV